MKTKTNLLILVLTMIMAVILTGCGSVSMDGDYGMSEGGLSDSDYSSSSEDSSGNQFDQYVENDFVSAANAASSAFRLSVSTSSYTFTRSMLENGYAVEPEYVRAEEFINYFDYDVVSPQSGTFGSYSNVYSCPWNEDNYLLRLTLKAKEVERESAASNLVFLIDTSGSMYGSTRLDLVKTAFSYLTYQLTENDRVSIVTYAGSNTIALDGGTGEDKQQILSIIDDLTAAGSTAGSSAIETAYALAEKHMIEGGNNRVILATDGDFNVGATSSEALQEQIASYKDKGIYFTGIGVGNGNYNNVTLETLANNGDGNAYYIDSETEAIRVFTEEIMGTLFTVAKDAKANVTFNTDVVDSYRLIGYDSILLSQEQFEDDDTDAGEVGSGHTVTVVYEIVAKGELTDCSYATAEVKYNDVETEEDTSETFEITPKQTNDDDIFIACVIEGALLLRNSEYKADASYQSVIDRLIDLNLTDTYKQEFQSLMQIASDMA